MAVEKGLGISLERTNSAKDYGGPLTKAGFKVVTGAPEPGDVRIIQPVRF